MNAKRSLSTANNHAESSTVASVDDIDVLKLRRCLRFVIANLGDLLGADRVAVVPGL